VFISEPPFRGGLFASLRTHRTETAVLNEKSENFLKEALQLSGDSQRAYECGVLDEVRETVAEPRHKLALPVVEGGLPDAEYGGNFPLGSALRDQLTDAAVVRIKLLKSFEQFLQQELVCYDFCRVRRGVGRLVPLIFKGVEGENAAGAEFVTLAAIAGAAASVFTDAAFSAFLPLVFRPCRALVGPVDLLRNRNLLTVDVDKILFLIFTITCLHFFTSLAEAMNDRYLVQTGLAGPFPTKKERTKERSLLQAFKLPLWGVFKVFMQYLPSCASRADINLSKYVTTGCYFGLDSWSKILW